MVLDQKNAPQVIKEGKQQFYTSVTSVNYKNDCCDKILNKWYSYVGGNQQLSSWTKGWLNRKDILPTTRNVDTFLGLMASWIFEKNLLLPLC